MQVMFNVMKQDLDPHNPMKVGGQAVIEGVMMRAPGRIATSVRRADGSIESRVEEHQSLTDRHRPLRAPVIRGAIGLIDMLFIGIRTLNYSAAVALLDLKKENGKPASQQSQKSENIRLAILVAFSLLIGIALFFATPLVVTSLLFNVQQDPLRFNLIAGGIRVGLLLGYLGVISTLKDVRRLFEYHGAEHKAIFAYEAGGQLDVATAARQTRFHPRCGTSFLLVVMLSSIILFGIVDALLIGWLGGLTLGMRLAFHLPLIPLVGGISYEFIRLSARHSDTLIGRIVVAPGLWLQKITTKEPDESQLEVALAALRAALGLDAVPANPPVAQEVAAR